MMTLTPKPAGGAKVVIRNIHYTVGTNRTFVTTLVVVVFLRHIVYPCLGVKVVKVFSIIM